MIDGLACAQKKKQWQANANSEPQSWDKLMIKPRYIQTLELALAG